MGRLFIFLTAILLLFSCQPNQEEAQEQVMPVVWDTVAYRKPQLMLQAPNCDTIKAFSCTKAKAHFVQIDQQLSRIDSAKINQLLRKAISRNQDNLTAYLQKFINEYLMILEEEPELLQGQAGWQLDIEQKVLCNTDRLFSVSNYIFLFTGGAHGRYSTTYVNIDLSTGRLLDLEDILKGEFIGELTTVGEFYFRQAYKIAKDADINSTGFWFEDDNFYLPENYGFTMDGIEFLYKPYEIASFADGEPRFTIPYTALDAYLKHGAPLPVQQLSLKH
ncbi:MAG: DUF3298 domain-containing protein [Phaeodactylibacter sp.]|nr:DUF3298 domain-containing protein [Phaeodactylibacter sp.]